jgi:hypothetical protein
MTGGAQPPAGDVTGVARALGLARPTPSSSRATAWVIASPRWPGSTGIAHSVPACVGCLERAGFHAVAAHEFVPTVLTRVVGRKTT